MFSLHGDINNKVPSEQIKGGSNPVGSSTTGRHYLAQTPYCSTSCSDRFGMSLTMVSKKYGVSRASVCRIMNLCQAEYHAVDANHLPLDMVKPGPVLVA
jgi:hypothetical protein